MDTPPLDPSRLSSVSSSMRTSSGPRRSLPPIRLSRVSTTTRPSDAAATLDNGSTVDALPPDSSVDATTVVNDIVSPLSPTASERERERQHRDVVVHAQRQIDDPVSRPLTLMLRRLEEVERCRWSGLIVILLYSVTVLIWPSFLVSALGMVCGASGFVSCMEPYTIQKILWVFVYAFLNIVMVVILGWVALDQLVFTSDNSSSVNYVYVSVFVLLGFVVHARALQASIELIQKCHFVPILLGAVIPERWRRTHQRTTTADQANRAQNPSQNDEEMWNLERHSSIHSFEVDIQSHRALPSPTGAQNLAMSPPLSPPLSPVALMYQKVEDEAHY